MARVRFHGGEPTRLRRLVENMPRECDTWRKFGMGLMVVAGGFAFSVWATVQSHPEQDLPLWPSWVLGALGCVGLVLTVATLLHLPPFRGSRPHRNI